MDGDLTSLADILITSWNGGVSHCHGDTLTHNSSLMVEVVMGIYFNAFIDPTDQFGL